MALIKEYYTYWPIHCKVNPWIPYLLRCSISSFLVHGAAALISHSWWDTECFFVCGAKVSSSGVVLWDAHMPLWAYLLICMIVCVYAYYVCMCTCEIKCDAHVCGGVGACVTYTIMYIVYMMLLQRCMCQGIRMSISCLGNNPGHTHTCGVGPTHYYS